MFSKYNCPFRAVSGRRSDASCEGREGNDPTIWDVWWKGDGVRGRRKAWQGCTWQRSRRVAGTDVQASVASQPAGAARRLTSASSLIHNVGTGGI